MVKLDLVYKYSFSFAFIEISKKNLAFLYKDKVFQFEILSFLIEFQVAHQKPIDIPGFSIKKLGFSMEILGFSKIYGKWLP